jgi:hypothetical protein
MEGHGTCCSLTITEERQLFDKNTSVMEPGSVYSSMKEFRLAMR